MHFYHAERVRAHESCRVFVFVHVTKIVIILTGKSRFAICLGDRSKEVANVWVQKFRRK